jgi:hypothetical protein
VIRFSVTYWQVFMLMAGFFTGTCIGAYVKGYTEALFEFKRKERQAFKAWRDGA